AVDLGAEGDRLVRGAERGRGGRCAGGRRRPGDGQLLSAVQGAGEVGRVAILRLDGIGVDQSAGGPGGGGGGTPIDGLGHGCRTNHRRTLQDREGHGPLVHGPSGRGDLRAEVHRPAGRAESRGGAGGTRRCGQRRGVWVEGQLSVAIGGAV